MSIHRRDITDIYLLRQLKPLGGTMLRRSSLIPSPRGGSYTYDSAGDYINRFVNQPSGFTYQRSSDTGEVCWTKVRDRRDELRGTAGVADDVRLRRARTAQCEDPIDGGVGSVIFLDIGQLYG